MSKSLALNCRGCFFTLTKYTLHLVESRSTYTIVVDKLRPWTIFTLTKNTLQLVESLAIYIIVVGNLRLRNNIPHRDKIPSSQVESRPPS